MTNMMIGAVAINGGVGVMEIRQPLPQAVESVAQAVEALAVNAHISLRELKNCVDKVLEKKIPGYKQLTAQGHPFPADEGRDGRLPRHESKAGKLDSRGHRPPAHPFLQHLAGHRGSRACRRVRSLEGSQPQRITYKGHTPRRGLCLVSDVF